MSANDINADELKWDDDDTAAMVMAVFLAVVALATVIGIVYMTGRLFA